MYNLKFLIIIVIFFLGVSVNVEGIIINLVFFKFGFYSRDGVL